jgi:hypothetical protein
MLHSFIDNPAPAGQTVRVKLKRAIFVKGQGAKKPGDVVSLDASEARELAAYDLFEEVGPEEHVAAEQ